MKLDVANDQPWYSEGLQFSCTQCGNCCTGGPGYVWISDAEVQRLAEHLKLSVPETLKQYCRKVAGRISLKEHRTPSGNYDCTFLEERPVPPKPGSDDRVVQTQRICTIYPVRPLQCRTWPFWDGLLASQASWNLAAKRCPGMNTGKSYSLPQIHALRDATDWPGR